MAEKSEWKDTIIKEMFGYSKALNVNNYSSNDYLNSYYEFLRTHISDEILEQAKSNHHSEKEFFDIFDSLFEKERETYKSILLLYYKDNQSYEQISKHLIETHSGNKDYTMKQLKGIYSTINIKKRIKKGIINLSSDDNLIRLFFSDIDFLRMCTWKNLTMTEKYPDIMNAALIETSLDNKIINRLFKYCKEVVGLNTSVQRLNIRDIYDNIENLLDIVKLGPVLAYEIIRLFDGYGIDTSKWKWYFSEYDISVVQMKNLSW